ncbi:MAG: ribonuclease HII [Proteobacteria bacterium]|nr:ribonuclease HII [Pseudomonadota bacterium]MBU4583069.1 ribonuclease HII [Pseudomonadota bacterium]MCG2741851.1 ribonuclease HII [Syntrophaceae bacterium]
MNSFERKAHGCGYRFVAGIDEAGRGPLAGPVVAAAVILPPGYQQGDALQQGVPINDSKKLSPRQRGKLYETITRDAVSVGIGVVEAPEIDAVNILQATLAAMKEAVLALSVPPDYLLIDGLNRIDLDTPQETIISGDSRSLSVAAASIVAKVSRDRLMEMYHRQFPQYNFLRNKGYGTREHREAILKYGRSKIHRRSFRVAGIDDLPVNEKLQL